jgi:uncharacterized protein (TIGR02145 family)
MSVYWKKNNRLTSISNYKIKRMKNKSLLLTAAVFIISLSSVAQASGTFTDSRDGKTYKTVKIGTQTWMAENLAYKASSGCWAYNDSLVYVTKYGYLYDWDAAKGISPAGWHIPSDEEWNTLITYLGGDSVAGGKLKSTTGWKSPCAKATNSSGFSALPGGSFDSFYLDFINIGTDGCWWSSSDGGSSYRIGNDQSRIIKLNYEDIDLDEFSVRCIKDK